MNLTPEEKTVGSDNYYEALGVSRRDFLKEVIAAGAVSGAGLGAMYFGYQKIGDPVRIGVVGTGDEGNVLESVLKRRLPQIVVATGVILYALLSFVDMLADREVLPLWAFRIALNTFLCGTAASGVIAWFHGKKGRQRVQPLEITLLVLIGAKVGNS